MTDQSPEWHFQHFKEFCKLETELKGPDPQLETTYAMCLLDNVDTMEMVWRAGLVVGVWNVPTAEQIWHDWPLERALREPEKISTWLANNWKGIFRRRERRCVNTVPKMTEYLQQLAQWVPKYASYEPDYEVYWKAVQNEVKFMGRYVALKYLEFLGQYCHIPISCPDIRAEGGWSPVRTLGFFYTNPLLAQDIRTAPSKHVAIATAEEYAATTLKRLHLAGIKINFFQLQVMLCEYRTCFEHAHQYPGRSLDEELEFSTKVNGYWSLAKDTTLLYRARLDAFPNVALGEFNGWNQIRKELGGTLRDHGYLWTDLRYDYQATTDLGEPAKR